MNIEEALTELGEDTLDKSPHKGLILVMINANIKKYGKRISEHNTGVEVLSLVYDIEDIETKERILTRELGLVRKRDRYKQTVVILSVVMGLILILVTVFNIGISIDESDIRSLFTKGLRALLEYFSEN